MHGVTDENGSYSCQICMSASISGGLGEKHQHTLQADSLETCAKVRGACFRDVLMQGCRDISGSIPELCGILVRDEYCVRAPYIVCECLDADEVQNSSDKGCSSSS